MTEVMTEHAFTDSFDSESYFIASVSVAWKWEDCGIGHYEFWGTVGNDVNMQLEFDGYYIEAIEIYDSDDVLTKSLENNDNNRQSFADIFDFVTRYVDDEVDNLDAPDDYYMEDEYNEYDV